MKNSRSNTDARRAASRRNGSKSRGATSAEGLLRTHAAALKHGLYATRTFILPGESIEEYNGFQAQLLAFWQPKGFYDQQLVEQLVGNLWETRRLLAAKNLHLYQEIATITRNTPGLDQHHINLLAEMEVTIPGGKILTMNARIAQLARERHRFQSELLALKKTSCISGSSQMSLILNNLQHEDIPAAADPKPAPGTSAELPYVTEAAPVPEKRKNRKNPKTRNRPIQIQEQPDNNDILDWAKSALEIEPDPVQAQVMTEQNSRILVLAPRQTGKSTAAALRVLYEAAHYDDAVILLASASGRQSGQIMEKARKMARFLDLDILPPPPKCDGFSLANGSQIIALPDNPETIRGFSAPRLIVVDEAAFASEDLFKALDPMLTVSNGTLMLLSTPNGQTGYFYEQWHAAATPWTRIFGTLADCPRVQPEAVEAIRKSMSEADFQQEFECKFIAGSAQFISREIIEQCIVDDYELVCPDFKWEYDSKDDNAKVPSN